MVTSSPSLDKHLQPDLAVQAASSSRSRAPARSGRTEPLSVLAVPGCRGDPFGGRTGPYKQPCPILGAEWERQELSRTVRSGHRTRPDASDVQERRTTAGSSNRALSSHRGAPVARQPSMGGPVGGRGQRRGRPGCVGSRSRQRGTTAPTILAAASLHGRGNGDWNPQPADPQRSADGPTTCLLSTDLLK